MKRYDTLTPKAKTAFLRTVEIAKVIGNTNFVCESLEYNLHCYDCPCLINDTCVPIRKTASEWLAWANKEVEEDR